MNELSPADQEELDRIDSETVTLGNATGMELGSMQGFGEAAKATLSPSASAATAIGMAASTPFTLWDKGTSFLTGKESTEASDWVFKNVVDDIGRRSEQYWRPNPDAMGTGARIGSMGFQLAGTLPQIMASPTVSIAGMTFSPTMDAIDQGASQSATLKIGATNLAVNAVGFGLPAAWGKTLFSRIATGSVSNALLGAVQEGYTGDLLTAEGNQYGSSYRWDNMENRLFELAIGGMFGYKLHVDAINDPNRHRVSSDEQDAVFAEINQDSLTNRTMPGLPMNSEATRQHMTAMDTAIQQFLKGEKVNVADSLDLNNFLVRPELRPTDYQPASATGKTAASYGAGFLTDANVYADFTAYRHALEVGKLGPDAKNPVSTATGNGQFIEDTWMALVKSHKPAWAIGLNKSQLLELRKDPEITAEMLKYQDQDHTAALLNAGLPVNFFTMYAAHHFGIGKGKAFAKAAGDTPMTDILTKAQIDANPHLRSMTKDGAQSYWNQKAEALGAKPETNMVNIERRSNPEARKRIADMTVEEARKELATSELTGGKNRRAYEDAPKLPVQVFLDANNLKWVNDTMGHAAGDDVIKAMHKALAKHTDEVYHLSGDEYVVQAKTEKQAKKIMADVQEELAKVKMEVTGKDGQIISKQGIGIGFGLGKTLDAADKAMQADKAAQEASGQRQARDANGLPFGVTMRAPEYANGIPKDLPYDAKNTDTAKLNASLSRFAADNSKLHDGARSIERRLLPARLDGLLEAFDKVTGRPVAVVRNLSPEVKDFNGATDGQRIFLNERSQHPLVTVAGHEFGHVLQENHPQLYAKLTDEIERQANVKAYGNERNYATDRTMVDNGILPPDPTITEPSKATVELTNDAIGDALTDKAFLNRMAKERPNVFKDIADKFIAYLDGLIERMGKIVGYGTDRYLTDVEQFRNVLAKVLNEYYVRAGLDPQRMDVLRLEDEIGWAQVGGQLVFTDGMAAGVNGQGGGMQVTGRSKWVAKGGPDGQESDFWANRPKGITEADARSAMAKYRTGDKLAGREVGFIKYAEKYAADREAERLAADVPVNEDVPFSDVMYSDKAPEFNVLKSTMDEFAKSVDKALSGKLHRDHHLIKMGRAPEVLKHLGLRDLELVVPKNEIIEQKHGIPMSVIKQMPAFMADPVAVFKSANKDTPNRIIVMTEAIHNSGPVVAVIEPDAKTNMGKVHFVTSVHAKTSPEKSIKSWIDGGLLLYRNKEKGSELWNAAGVQFPGGSTKQSLSGAKILTNEDIVNTDKSGLKFSDTLDGQRPQPEDLPEYVPPPVELTAEERFAMPKADQAKADAEQAKMQAEYEKQRSLRHKVLSAVAGDQLRQAMAAFPGPPMQALDHILARSADVKGNVLSVESQAKAIREDAFRQIIPVLQATNPKFFGLFESKQGVRELVMELHGQNTGNPDAKAGAKAFRKVADQLRERFNRAGGDVGQIEDWGMPHHHSQHLVAKAGKAKWVADITPKLNRKRYDMTDAELNDMLGRVWETIATNGVNKLESGQFPGSGKVANRGNEARQLHFMDGDAYLAYQHDYGESAPYETITGHIGRLAHDIAMIETMGPNPDQMFRTLKDEAFKFQVTTDPTNMGKHEKQARWLDTLYREVSGKARPVASRLLAKAFDEWRSLMVSAKLGSASITAITDHGPMHTNAMAANLPQLQLFANELAAFNLANVEEKARLNRMGLGLSSMIGELNRFGNDVVSSGFFNKLGTATMRLSGLAASTDARRRAYGATMLDAVGAITQKHASLADIDPMDHRVLMSKGITETDFQVWKRAELDELGANHTMLTPDAIYAIPDAKLADIADAMGNPMDPDQLRQQAVTKLLGATFDEVDIGVIESSARERALMHGDRVRGTWKGETITTLFLFKSFPVTMITKHWARMMSMPTNRGKAAYGVSLMASTTALGMAALQIANMLVGKDPADMTDGKNWIKALLKGGGLSLFGDYLVADQTQYGSSFIASLGGPGAGMIEDTYNLTLGNMHQAQRGENTHIGAEAIKFAKSNTPFANLWYTRAATDHLIINELQEMASPGYLRKMEKRAKKEYDETYFWKPGTPLPQRTPDLEKAVGE